VAILEVKGDRCTGLWRSGISWIGGCSLTQNNKILVMWKDARVS
jgi:hypothetical protein